MVTGSSPAMLTAEVPAADGARLLDPPFSITASVADANVPARRAPAFDEARLLGLLSHP